MGVRGKERTETERKVHLSETKPHGTKHLSSVVPLRDTAEEYWKKRWLYTLPYLCYKRWLQNIFDILFVCRFYVSIIQIVQIHQGRMERETFLLDILLKAVLGNALFIPPEFWINVFDPQYFSLT